MERVKISCYTDALCVWAYIAQVRIDELRANFKDCIEMDYRYFHIFGNVTNKMNGAWKERGGLPGYVSCWQSASYFFNVTSESARSWTPACRA